MRPHTITTRNVSPDFEGLLTDNTGHGRRKIMPIHSCLALMLYTTPEYIPHLSNTHWSLGTFWCCWYAYGCISTPPSSSSPSPHTLYHILESWLNISAFPVQTMPLHLYWDHKPLQTASHFYHRHMQGVWVFTFEFNGHIDASPHHKHHKYFEILESWWNPRWWTCANDATTLVFWPQITSDCISLIFYTYTTMCLSIFWCCG
jgi:hypothetical protein